jgi:hypothetical protein
LSAAPRRTCPACSRRYAGLIAPDCPICQGLGVLTLGAAALHHFEPAAIARAIELYLEAKARQSRHELPLGSHRQALEAHVDELRVAGVLATTADGAGHPARNPVPPDASSARVAELDAYRATRSLGATPDTAVLNALNALNAPELPLDRARPRDGRPPQASATGHPSAIATIADPIDPLGPNTGEIAIQRDAHTHRARVIAASIPAAATRRRNRP